MAKSSSNPDSNCPSDFERREDLAKNHYFDNETVERLMHRYVEGACTDSDLRDEIMDHASELIRNIIKAHNLGQICPGKDDTAKGDLFQTAWIQIESALYKYEARPHCSATYHRLRPNDSLLIDEYLFVQDLIKKFHSKCPICDQKIDTEHIYYRGKSKVFNLWSQIARTVGLAYIKKENRDRKNSGIFQKHLEERPVIKNEMLGRFFLEAREIFKYNTDHLKVLNCIEDLYEEDEKPHEGLIGKLVDRSGLPRTTVTGFLRLLRLRSKDFTDSPVNEERDQLKSQKPEPDHEQEN
jgi:hypothetical protein